FAAGAGRIARRDRMAGVVPLGVLDVVTRGAVALPADAAVLSDRNLQCAAAEVRVLASRSMAIFALNVAEVLELVGQRIECAGFERSWKSPVELLGDVIKSTVDRVRVGVISHGVAGETTL